MDAILEIMILIAGRMLDVTCHEKLLATSTYMRYTVNTDLEYARLPSKHTKTEETRTAEPLLRVLVFFKLPVSRPRRTGSRSGVATADKCQDLGRRRRVNATFNGCGGSFPQMPNKPPEARPSVPRFTRSLAPRVEFLLFGA